MVAQRWSYTGLDDREVGANTLSLDLGIMAMHDWTANSCNKAKVAGELNDIVCVTDIR